MSRILLRLLLLSSVVLAVWVPPAQAQPGSGTVRIALLSQWVVNQHRAGIGPGSPLSAEFRRALEGGVVDRVVFWWQRGVIQREFLVRKPVRVVTGPEAQVLGGRGAAELVSVGPPAGRAAWTDVEVARADTGDVLVLEVGGELNTVRQVLETVFVAGADGALAELGLARRALVPGAGVPVTMVPFGRPVSDPGASGWFRGVGGVEFLVVRSPVETIPNGAVTTNGPADMALTHNADWREGDRVFLRIAAATLRAGAPSVVLGWKDRVDRPDGGDTEQLRRSSRVVPRPR